MLAIVLMVVGALLVTGGATVIYWPAGIVVAGAALVLFGIDLARPDRARPADS